MRGNLHPKLIDNCSISCRESDFCIIHYDALVTLGIRGGLLEGYGKQYYCPSHIFCSLLTWLAKLMSLLLWFNRVRGLAGCYADIMQSALVATRIWEFTAFLKYPCVHGKA